MGSGGMCFLDYIAKRKLRKLLLPDIPLQDDFEDSSFDSDEQDKSRWLGI